MLQNCQHVLYIQYNIRVTHRNGAIKHIFYTNQIHGGSSADCSLFILSLHAHSSSGRLKYYFKSFCMKICEHVSLCHSVGCIPSRMPAGPHFVTQPILLSGDILIFDINHQQNTRRSDQIETIKTIMPDYAALVSHGRFYQWLRLPFLKEIFDQVRKDLDCELFYSGHKT